MNILFFFFFLQSVFFQYQWHFTWQLMGVCVPFTLLDCYRFSHLSHRPHEVPGPLWRLGPFFSYSCQFPIQWYFLISLMLLVLRGLHFSHPPSSHSWVLYFLVFHGTVVASSILWFLQNQYLALSHITLDGCTSKIHLL